MTEQPKNNDDLFIDLIQTYEPGNIPPAIFEAIARITVYPAVEFIPLRMTGGSPQVLLFERPPDDIMWPAMLHTPGTVLRPTDKSLDDVLKRLYKDELDYIKIGKTIFLGPQLDINKRGRVLYLEYLLIIESNPKTGKFYYVDNLPDNFIKEQMPSLNRAVKAFRDMK